MQVLKQIFAVLVGVIILVLVILAAKWTGEKIRERFFKPLPPQIVLSESDINPKNPLANSTNSTASYSAIPKTGPEMTGFVMITLSAIGGLYSFALAKKSS